MVKDSKFRAIVQTDALIIKDPNYFKITYTPKQIIERKETYELYRGLSIFTRYRKANNLLLKGFPGSGKTVTVNFITNEIKAIDTNIDVKIINCSNKTPNDILKVFNDNSAKGSFHNMMNTFLQTMEKDTLIILDEIDRSIKVNDLLYYLSRPTELFQQFSKNISLILISNNLHWEDNLRDDIRSSLQLKTIVFDPYSESELKNILNDRIKNGYKNPEAISKDLIDLIAKRVSDNKGGDCRVAIEAVFYAAQFAEMKKNPQIEKEHVYEALKIAINESDKMLISKLQDNQLLTLFVVSQFQYKSIDEIREHYIHVIKNDKLNIEPISTVMIFHIVNYLNDLCLIKKSIITDMGEDKIPKNRTNIEVKVDKQLILDELVMRGLRLANKQ
jgi:Cdc6-like AAA superfamily ATPase